MSELISYWPSAEHVRECLRTEAETIDEALLLAVHEPVSLRKRAAHTGKETEATEGQLLNELMRPSDDGSAVLVAITGASGVGKSHMVKWVRAQLLRHPQRDRLVIVTIPKTASLRQVVERMLEPLGGEAYATIKRDLNRAVDAMDANRAAELLAATLGEELEAFARSLQEDVQANKVPRDQGARINIARKVRVIVRDPQVRDSWFQKVFVRIIGSSLDGTADPDDRRFHARDFEPPADAPINDFPQETNSALHFMARNDGADRVRAAEVLQEVLDPSLRSVFGFTETLRQKTIQEVVDDIRRQMLADGRELVLLIEDLAALAGIQQPLLDIIIAESDEEGRRVRAPIRTALAVTDGFLPGRQTLLTRAKAEWVIPSEGLSNEVVVSRLVELTGRYLNAARWGLKQLKSSYAKVLPDERNLYHWVPGFDETLDASSADRLAAFGKSNAGHALYPFTRMAIQSLGEQALKRGGQWVFNPRAFINEVLQRVLSQRSLAEQARFPAALPNEQRVVSEVGMALGFKGYAPTVRSQVEALLFHWAGNPRSLTEAPLVSEGVFDAFGAPWPFGSAAPSQSPPRPQPEPEPGPGPGPKPPPPPPPPLPPPPVPEASEFAQALETWGPTTLLIGKVANRARILLAEALNQRINFDLLGMHGAAVERTWFWLPPNKTTSNPSSGIIVRVASDAEAIPSLVVAGLRALDRWETHGKHWRYDGAEDDYATANALADLYEDDIVAQISQRAGQDVGVLATVLHRQALLLGLSRKPEPEGPRIDELMANAPEQLPAPIDAAPAVRAVLDARAEAAAARPALQEQLRYRLGCYQGVKGASLLAIDSVRLKSAWKATRPERLTLVHQSKEPLSPAALSAMERMDDAAVVKLIAQMRLAQEAYRPRVAEAFEPDHARVAWKAQVLETFQMARTLSLWPPECDESRVRKAIEELSAEGLETVFNRARSFVPPEEDKSIEVKLEAWGALSLPKLLKVAAEVDRLVHFFDALERNCGKQVDTLGDEALKQRTALINSLNVEEA
ncbi:protein DpdH [Variovorax sp. LT1P1]|uniref:protein DpdH n=1 Tax=Variovorax sp. LT1P1 TaxID=3443730 RepID=UPI003F456796